MSREEIEPAAVSAARRAKAATGGKIATANRLRDGRVVYWNGNDWVTEVDQAAIARTEEEEKALKAALDTAFKPNLILDIAVIDISATGKSPARLREQIRAVGPTVRPDLARRPPL
jgi:hypothetical protein